MRRLAFFVFLCLTLSAYRLSCRLKLFLASSRLAILCLSLNQAGCSHGEMRFTDPTGCSSVASLRSDRSICTVTLLSRLNDFSFAFLSAWKVLETSVCGQINHSEASRQMQAKELLSAGPRMAAESDEGSRLVGREECLSRG